MPKLGLGLGLPTTRVASAPTPPPPIPSNGLSLWLKADAGVTLSGFNVTSWADQSGNSVTAQEGIGISPVFNPSDLNSKPTILLGSLSGGETRLFELQNANSVMGLAGTTAFAVMYVDNVCNEEEPDDNGPVFGNFGSAVNTTHMPYGPDCNVYDGFASANRKGPLTAPSNIVGVWSIYSVTSTTNNWRNYINGVLMHFDNSNVYSNAIYNNQLYIGYATAGGGYGFKGKVAEIVVYNRVLTTPEREEVEAYLNDKYAIY